MSLLSEEKTHSQGLQEQSQEYDFISATTQPPQDEVNAATCQVSEETEDDTSYNLFAVRNECASPPIEVTVQVNGTDLVLEVDTGATSSIISEATYKQLWHRHKAPPLHPTSKRLCTYTREPLNVKGSIEVTAEYRQQTAKLELTVVTSEGPALLGQDWLQTLGLDWERLSVIHQTETLEQVLDRHPDVFKDELGLVEAAPAKIHVDPSAQPKFCKARTIPYAL